MRLVLTKDIFLTCHRFQQNLSFLFPNQNEVSNSKPTKWKEKISTIGKTLYAIFSLIY